MSEDPRRLDSFRAAHHRSKRRFVLYTRDAAFAVDSRKARGNDRALDGKLADFAMIVDRDITRIPGRRDSPMPVSG